MRFSALVCHIQVQHNRYFIFEHPRGATSWKTRSIQELLAVPGVFTNYIDMCAYGLRARDAEGEGAVKKTTTLMSNLPAVRGGNDQTMQR